MGAETPESIVPIKNVFYLLSYAWRRLDEAEIVEAHRLDAESLVDLFGRILATGTTYLLRRGLDRGYRERGEQTSSIRGRIDFQRSIGLCLFPNAKAWCVADELTHDVLHNQILKATLRSLFMSKAADRSTRDLLHGLYRRLNPVRDIKVTGDLFRRVQLHRNNAFYGFLMDVCEFIHTQLLPEESEGEVQFRDFRRNRDAMAKLFEDFVREFYRAEQSAFEVRAKRLAWQEVSGDPGALSLLPNLNTDITLIGPERIVVMDTKYYEQWFVEHHGKRMINPSHLNQLYSYLANISKEAALPPDRVEGVLLYPVVKEAVSEPMVLHGHRFRVETIDLNQPWDGIKADLLGLVH